MRSFFFSRQRELPSRIIKPISEVVYRRRTAVICRLDYIHLDITCNCKSTTMKNLITTLIILFTFTASAQEMNIGYKYLETQEYLKASIFFDNILQDFPNNMTARLCHGRALGLMGNTSEAKLLFSELLKEYPGDLELELNFAESLLWSSEFSEAKTYYQELVKNNPENFSALLGFSNTLSNLKDFNSALIYIAKALAVDPGNMNALISRKYIRMGKAATLVESNQINKALELLNLNLIDFPKDTDTQLNKINIYLLQNDLDNAQELYDQLNDDVLSKMGLSLIAHKKHKNKKALHLANEAKLIAAQRNDNSLALRANERYIQALLWNGKLSEAKKQIEEFEAEFPTHTTVNSLWATYGMYSGKFNKSLDNYKQILAKDSTSFDGNLGIANTYRAKGELTKAYEYATKTLLYYPNQKDALGLIKTIEAGSSPSINTRAAYTIDNGDNEAYSFSVASEIPWSERFVTTFGYNYRTTQNLNSNEMAYNTNATLGLKYRVLNNTWVEGQLGFLKANATTNNYKDLNGAISIKSRPFPLQYLELEYRRELQNFNASLIDKKIFMNNFKINYNLGTNFGLGWYTSYIFTTQTDSNTRNLLFTSLYYNITKRPSIKAGVNYQHLSFKEQIPELYFSPSKYQSVEAFIDVSGKHNNWYYSINGAGGYQYVEDNNATSLFRMEGKIDYLASSRLKLGVYGKYSNNASETAAGFQFTEVGFKLRWQFTEKPLFKFN